MDNRSYIKHPIITSWLIALLMAFVTVNSAVVLHAEPAKDSEQTCPERPQGNKIARTIMALAAAKNCPSFPISKEQIEEKLQTLNCNAKTGKAIQNMKAAMMPRMETLYQGAHGEQMCAQAANQKFIK